MKAVGKPGRGMRQSDFENKLTITRMVLWPCDSGRSVMKSIAMCDQDLYDTGRGSTLLAGRVWGTLAWAQAEQGET